MIDPVLKDYLDACDEHLSGHEQQFSSGLGLLLLAELAADAGERRPAGGEHDYTPLRVLVEQVLPGSEAFEPTGLRP
ncbi:hypothetical protein KWH04_17900 [Xanthomonas campestris pv. trichodesmae]|uniref:IS4 family transposase n=2 Tax=Xanthomonas citri TaxID=346 RepID=A0AB33CLK8_XANCI|nr:hypothetical protein [Xanthomonas citri]MBV6782481.1 hypothetical protein [Xanthomonas campestris pv. trichodesmae]ASK94664.1 hypothetical protein XcvCFBP7111P_24580 [Xanthomonas citri pv. vignicola]ASK94769.1 hypothetical protein XcvCFBP7111P_25260 [Xanthomonas citri pv. vignicola]MBZ3922071.1 hypothetical protein [Xanthomonas campestris pv. trichodesmae]MBZ3926162.1 hypothetical protein [Xanthomonas citri pv. sesbaniae]